MDKKPKKIGLALGGGGAKGLAHIGIIKALERGGIPIDFVAGTSMGAIVGGWYALTGDIEELEEIFLKVKLKDFFKIKNIIKGGKYARSEGMRDLLVKNFGSKTIEDCRLPFAAIATDVKNGDEVVLKKGRLIDAVEASASLPIIFDPVKIDDKLLMDGGFSNPVPADIARKMGADYVIAVDVSSEWNSYQENPFKIKNIASVMGETLSIIDYQLAKNVLKTADIVLRPPVLSYDWTDFNRVKEIIKLGSDEGRANLKTIRKGAGYPEPSKTLGEKFLDFIFNTEDNSLT